MPCRAFYSARVWRSRVLRLAQCSTAQHSTARHSSAHQAAAAAPWRLLQSAQFTGAVIICRAAYRSAAPQSNHPTPCSHCARPLPVPPTRVSQELSEFTARAERYVGVTSGGMDQAISVMGMPGMALMVEFNPVSHC